MEKNEYKWDWVSVILFFVVLAICIHQVYKKKPAQSTKTIQRPGPTNIVNPQELTDIVNPQGPTDIVQRQRKILITGGGKKKEHIEPIQQQIHDDTNLSAKMHDDGKKKDGTTDTQTTETIQNTIAYKFTTYPRTVFRLTNQEERDWTEQSNKMMYRINTYARQFLASVPQDQLVKQFVRFNVLGQLQKPKNENVVIPRYNFTLPKEHSSRFAKPVHELFEKFKVARETHDLKLTQAQRLETIREVIALTQTQSFYSVNDYFYKRQEVWDVIYSDRIEVEKDHIDAIDNGFRFYETANTNGHCGYLAAGCTLLLSLLKSQKVHNRVLGIYKVLLQFYTEAEDARKQNDMHLVIQSMVRMHLSSYGTKKRIATAQEVLSFMKVTYANLSGVQPFSELSKDRLLEIIMMLTVLFRVYVFVLFFGDPSYLIGAILLNQASPYFVKLKAFFQYSAERFEKLYQHQLEPEGDPITISASKFAEAILNNQEFEYERQCTGVQEHIESLVEKLLYSYGFIQKLFQVNMVQTDVRSLKFMRYHYTIADIGMLYQYTYVALNGVIEKLLTQVMTTDVYGGIYDVFTTGKDTYAKINWEGVGDCFCNIMPMVLGEHFDIDTAIPMIWWENNGTYRQIISNRMMLHYTRWKQASQTPAEIAKYAKNLQGFSPKDPSYSPENIAYVLDVTNRAVNKRLNRYPCALIAFPNHVSLLVANNLFEEEKRHKETTHQRQKRQNKPAKEAKKAKTVEESRDPNKPKAPQEYKAPKESKTSKKNKEPKQSEAPDESKELKK